MGFLETIRRAKDYLRDQGRVSLRVLEREFGLEAGELDELVDELVDVQRVAVREGKVLVWVGGVPPVMPAEATEGTEAKQTEAPRTQAEPEAERRQLTVLFCDLVDSTRLAAHLDPEDWRDVVRSYQEAAGKGVERFGGHVAQYLGDGILAYFGWPRAHEDDAERAVRAALAIVEAVQAPVHPQLGETLRVRAGIHTGLVVVGEIGAGARRDTLALGDATNVAARLQALAEPGTVLLSPTTLRLVQGIFLTRDLGERALKGLDGLLRVHQAIRPSGVRSRLDVAAAAGLTPLVGRDQELLLLEDRFGQVREGHGHAVLVAGEAGIGKSRLVQAFRERIAERAHTWLECRGSVYTQESALHPVLELQRHGLGFGPEDPPAAKVTAIEAGLAAAGFDLAANVPLLASFHGVALPESYAEPMLAPEGRRKQTLALLVEWLLRLGREQPVALLLEDLHWMDPSTLELLGQILERIPTAQVLLLATYRPDFEPQWGAGSHLTPMQLSRLARAQIGDLVSKAARGRDLPDAWVEEIIRRSDGVPLFAEELTRAVLETHAESPREGETPTLHIPETLQDSLTARLDALGPAKELAQLGSVLGREFSWSLLLAVSPMTRADLEHAVVRALREELFYQRGTPPDATYLFKHALLRDAAYQSMLRSTRQRHHRRVAETLVERMPEISENQPELVAQHWTGAGDAERALSWWQRAGDRASARAAYAEAITHGRRGLALLPSLAEGPERERRELGLQLRLAQALVAARGYAHAETRQAWERARALVDPKADSLRAAVIENGLTNTQLSAGEPRQSFESSTRVLRLADGAGELARIAGHSGRGNALFYLGEFRASQAEYEEALALYDPDRHDFVAAGFLEDEGVSCWAWSSHCLSCLGFPDRARTAAERARWIASHGRAPVSLALATCWASMGALLRRAWAEASALGEDAAVLAERQGFPLFEALGRLTQAFAVALSGGDPSSAELWIEQAGATGNLGGAPAIVGIWGEVQLAMRRLEPAGQTLEGALALAAHTGQRFYDAELHRLEGELVLARDPAARSESEVLFQRALEIAREQGATFFELRAATSLARLWSEQGQRDQARALLAPIHAWFTEGLDSKDLVDAKALLEELSQAASSRDA